MDEKSTLWQALKVIINNVETQISKQLRHEYEIGISEYRALSLLIEAKNSELRMQELANLLGLNQSSVTRLVERLEKKGYTIRDLCPKDKRGVYSVITGKGREVQHLAEKDYFHHLRSALDNIESNEINDKITYHLRQMLQH